MHSRGTSYPIIPLQRDRDHTAQPDYCGAFEEVILRKRFVAKAENSG